MSELIAVGFFFCTRLLRSQQTALGFYVEKNQFLLFPPSLKTTTLLLSHCCRVWKCQLHNFLCTSKLFPWRNNKVPNVLLRHKCFHTLILRYKLSALELLCGCHMRQIQGRKMCGSRKKKISLILHQLCIDFCTTAKTASWGVTAVQWLALQPHNKKVLTSKKWGRVNWSLSL